MICNYHWSSPACCHDEQVPCSLSLWPSEGSSFTLPSSSFGRLSKETASSWAGVNPGAAARALHTPLCLLSLLHLHKPSPSTSAPALQAARPFSRTVMQLIEPRQNTIPG